MKKINFNSIKSNMLSIINKIGGGTIEKFKNINGKTAMGNVPEDLFQKRTSRQNRVLISWKTIKNNNLTIDQLETFEGGVCVELVNDDYFQKNNHNDPVFKELIKRIGSDEIVSSIICFRTEDGDPGANIARKSYEKYLKLKPIPFKDPITRIFVKDNKGEMQQNIPGKDNKYWKGNIYYYIKGGSQKTISSHEGLKTKFDKEPTLFNPAIEYANEEVCNDLYITLFYFFIHCHDITEYISDNDLIKVKEECKSYLCTRNYDDGNLYDYCINHPSLIYQKDILMDPISVSKLSVQNFISPFDFKNPLSIAICHNEAANKGIIKFDKTNNYVVTAARPTNMFWGLQTSNMIQQSYALEEYFEVEKERVERRKKINLLK
jgi:hypothetical protein